MAPPLFRVYIAMSLDGYIATPDGEVDWLEPFQAADFGYQDFIATIGSIVMGRKTYEQVCGFGAWPYPGKRTLVLSSRPLAGLPDGTSVARGDIRALAADLKAAGRDVWIHGGARTIRGFLDLGLADRLEIYVIPVLLGDGLPLFPRTDQRARLTLDGTQAFPCGVVKLAYSFA